MNVYTVRKATQGVANEILGHGGDFAEKGVVIAYDSRNNSSSFAYEFKIDAEKVMGLIDKAAYIGVELFLIDDGWFGTRDDETSGLGDWYPNKKKFPDGLTPIIKNVMTRV